MCLAQVPWLKSCLETSNSTWDLVIGHYALYGSDVQWALNSTKSPFPGNCGGFGSVASLISEYDVAAYFNGHDHTSTHADPTHSGRPLTSFAAAAEAPSKGWPAAGHWIPKQRQQAASLT